jgi:OmpA-OmpF porin, OOP family
MKNTHGKMTLKSVNIIFITLKLAVILTVLILSACAVGNMASGEILSSNGGNDCRLQVGQSTEGKAIMVCFPNAGKAWLKGGRFVNVENLRRMSVGMSEDQVRELISHPHFSEGFLHANAWNYVFNFRTGAAKEFMTCQYQVQYKDGFSINIFWDKPACVEVLNPKLVEVFRPMATVTPSVVVLGSKDMAMSEIIRLSSDVIFTNNIPGSSDILSDGRSQLDKLVARLKKQYERIDMIAVTGHTDRLDKDDTHGKVLSTVRAATIRDYLIGKGMSPDVVRSYGAGKVQPLVQCDDKLTHSELAKCLQPNRRVEIEIVGEKR